MVSRVNMSRASQQLRTRFPPGTEVNVVPTAGSYAAEVVTMAGMRVRYLEIPKWPFPELILKFSQISGDMRPLFVSKAAIDYHDEIVNYVYRGIASRPGGAAIKEVTLNATVSVARADADIIAKAPFRPGDSPQVLVEVKTGLSADVRGNQDYVYSLALIGGHVVSADPRLPQVGLTPAVPLPAMDFLLITNEGRNLPIIPYLVRASIVDRVKSIAALTAYLKALRSVP